MNVKEFNSVKKLVAEYMNTLDIKEVKSEFLKNGLLTQNKKLSKGDNVNYGLELLPSVLSGKNLCPNAGSCKLTCIAFTGIANLLKSKTFDKVLSNTLKSKARKTFLFLNDRDYFISMLKEEIRHKHNIHSLLGERVYFRLNVTSDIEWEFLTNSLPECNFYDYTKLFHRRSTFNYTLTYSASEHTSFSDIKTLLNDGQNVSMVFNISNKKPMIEKYNGFDVVDGDVDDNRYDDKHGVIIGLRYKTPAMGGKNDKFVFDV